MVVEKGEYFDGAALRRKGDSSLFKKQMKLCTFEEKIKERLKF